jgi:hypothetical protein
MFKETQNKANALDTAIRQYVSEYGVMVPSVKNEANGYKPNEFSKYFTSHMICVDHASFAQYYTNVHTPEMMAAITKIADQVCKRELGGYGIHYPATGKNRGVRRHFIADPNDGLPLFTRRNAEIPCQAHRPGRNLSLLVRSAAKAKMLTAIVDTGTNIQAFITTSGISKSQPDDSIFLPQTSPEEVEGWELVAFHDWFGNVKYVWVSPDPKRDSKDIGKFTCPNGSRFEPRYVGQVYDQHGNNVDLLMPIEELREKSLVDEFLNTPNGYWGTITTQDGSEHKAFFVERTFLRSGAPGENIKPKYHQRWGMEGFCGAALAAGLQQHGFDFEFDTERQRELIEVGGNIIDVVLELKTKFQINNSSTEDMEGNDYSGYE